MMILLMNNNTMNLFFCDYLQDDAEDLEMSFLNRKRNFKCVRSTKGNRNENHHQNRWVNASRHGLRNERKTRKLQQVTAQKFNNQLDLVIKNSCQDFNNNKNTSNNNHQYSSSGTTQRRGNKSDIDLKEVLRLSAKEYAIQVSKNVPIGSRQLADLMSRDLTPEDYELLLLLDETVAKKTIETTKIIQLQKIHYSSSESLQSTCAICMVNYDPEEEITQLPCKHTYHSPCIEKWLSSANVTCPLDNIPVEI